MNKLVVDTESYKFIERFLHLKNDLLDFADRYHELEPVSYTHLDVYKRQPSARR